jgi:hypothetical protein
MVRSDIPLAEETSTIRSRPRPLMNIAPVAALLEQVLRAMPLALWWFSDFVWQIRDWRTFFRPHSKTRDARFSNNPFACCARSGAAT